MIRLALIVCLFSSAAFAEQELPVYPGAVHTRIGNDLLIDGQPYRIAYFTTTDSPKQVGLYFYKLWTTAGYPTTVDGNFDPEGVVSAFYTREGLQRSIVLTSHAGKTLGFTVLKDLWTTSDAKPAPGLVQIEGTLFSSDLSSRGDENTSQQRTALVQHDVPTTLTSVVDALKAKGFSLVRKEGGGAGNKSVVVELARGQEQVMTTLMPVDGGMTAVLQSWTGAHSTGGKK